MIGPRAYRFIIYGGLLWMLLTHTSAAISRPWTDSFSQWEAVIVVPLFVACIAGAAIRYRYSSSFRKRIRSSDAQLGSPFAQGMILLVAAIWIGVIATDVYGFLTHS